MNEIEQRFYNAYCQMCLRECTKHGLTNSYDLWIQSLKPQQVIGIYKVDFLYDTDPSSKIKIVIEIDGHENHKTKEQREHDYRRERYLQERGYLVIRFMGTEVFLDADGCINQFCKIAKSFFNIEVLCYGDGFNDAVNTYCKDD